MPTDSPILQFYDRLPALGNAVVSRLGWCMLDAESGRVELGKLQNRGAIGVLPFLTTPSGTLGLHLAPQTSVEDAPGVLVYPDVAEAITLGFRYSEGLPGLFNYENWPARDRSAEVDRSLSETVRQISDAALAQLTELLVREEAFRKLTNRHERIALGWETLGTEPNRELMAQLWRLRREPAAQAAGDYVRRMGEDWRLPLRVFAGFLALRKAPIALQRYAATILLDQQLCDVTYSGNHYGNVPGSWQDRSEVLLAQWLITRDRLPKDSEVADLAVALVESGRDYDGQHHAALAERYAKEKPELAWRLGQAAAAYATAGSTHDFLLKLAKRHSWSLLIDLLNFTS